MDIKSVIEVIVRDGFILVFNEDCLDVVRTAAALQEAGICQMEVTCRIRRPLAKIERLRDELPEFVVGSASLIDYDRVLARHNAARLDDPLPTPAQSLDSGAHYLVSAGNFSSNTYERFAGRVPLIPGCGTISEVLDQFDRGANLCKLFPAQQLGGPGFVKAFDAAAHRFIPLIPTGGTGPGNLADYVAAGVFVVGGSFSMLDKAVFECIVEGQDYAELTRQFAHIKNQIDELRARQWPDLDFAAASLGHVADVTGRDFNV